VTTESEKIINQDAAATKAVVEEVDSLNELAEKQFDTEASLSYETAKKSSEKSIEGNYAFGEAQALMLQGMALSKLRQYADALATYKASLNKFEKLKNQEAKGILHHKLGNTYFYLGKYTDAISHYENATDIKMLVDDVSGAAAIYSNLGSIYGLLGDYSLGLKSIMKALKIFEQNNDLPKIAAACTNIGLTYNDLHLYDEALKMYDRALKIRLQLNDQTEVSNLWGNIGVAYHYLGKYPEAKEMHEQALNLQRQIGDKSKIAVSLSNLADVYKSLKKYSVALDYYSKALLIFEELTDKREMVLTYYNIGELHFLINEYEDAGVYLNKAISIAEETGLKDHLRETYVIMAQIHAINKNFEEAYNLNFRVIELDKEISSNETSRAVAKISMQHEIEQKERENELERIRNVELTKAYQFLDEEKKNSEKLLLNILPYEIAEELKQKGEATAKFYDNVTVLFTDFKDFTTISEKLSPQELVNELHECFKGFDEIIAKYNIEKIKTVGDAYLAVSGLPSPNLNHATDILHAAIEIRDFMEKREAINSDIGKESFQVRIGIHSGHVVAGIVGVTKFAFDIWGDAVNTAARMEQNSEVGKINVSQASYDIVNAQNNNTFSFEYRGEINAKNKGNLKMYFLK
jgi:adenylate cyclase